MPGPWYTGGGNIARTPADAAFTIAEVEDAGDRDGIVAALGAGKVPAIPRAIITTFVGLVVKRADGTTDVDASRAKAAPLVAAGFDCITEAYARREDGTPTGRTAESMEAIARDQLGFERVWDCYGLFGGAKLADYPQRQGYSVWLAEWALA